MPIEFPRQSPENQKAGSTGKSHLQLLHGTDEHVCTRLAYALFFLNKQIYHGCLVDTNTLNLTKLAHLERGSLGFFLRALFFATNREGYWISIEYVFLTEAQKKQMEDNADLIQEECISENADNSTEDPIEGGPDADGDGEDMTDGIEEDFDEDGSNELVRNNDAMIISVCSCYK